MNTRTGTGTLSHKSGSLRYTLHKKANETLEKGGIEAAVICPEDVDQNEWIAVHAIDFYNDVNLIYGVVQEECTNYSCPIMSAGDNYEFLWTDKYKYGKPTRLPAKVYIDYLMNWIVHLLEDETLFPVEPDTPFPPDYMEKVRNIFRRMFRVYAHIYYSHMTLINRLELTDQFKFSLTHFLFFVNQFNLVNPSDLRPLRELVNVLAPNLRLTQELNELYKKKERLRHSASKDHSKPDDSKSTHSRISISTNKEAVSVDTDKSNGYYNNNDYASNAVDFNARNFNQGLPTMSRRLVTSKEASASLYNNHIQPSYETSNCNNGPSQYNHMTANPVISNRVPASTSVTDNYYVNNNCEKRSEMTMAEALRKHQQIRNRAELPSCNPEEASPELYEEESDNPKLRQHIDIVNGDEENKCDCVIY